jgi:hypothetical protein
MKANMLSSSSRKKGGEPKLPATEANKAISVRIDSRKKRIVVRDFVSVGKFADF